MNNEAEMSRMRTALALLRITLGLIILVTWYDNLRKGLYTADGLTGFLNWLADPAGNGGSLAFYHTLVSATIVPIAGIFARLQMVAELIMGLALLLGGLTRLFGIAAMIFFFNLFLAYFGGEEWIWTYVLFLVVAAAVALGAAGRKWGIDGRLRQKVGQRQLLRFS